MVFEESIVLSEPFPQAVDSVKAALQAEGFGVLTEIDVQATLLAKIGKPMEPYLIIGACNPAIASRALDIDPQVGVLLPCNVVVRQTPAGVLVEALDPGVLLSLSGNEHARPVVDDARQLIGAALNRLQPNAAAGVQAAESQER